MKLTSIIRELETKLKSAEKLAATYDAQAQNLRRKLTNVAQVLGRSQGAAETRVISAPARGRGLRGRPSSDGRARIAEAQRKRWAVYRASRAETKSAPAAKSGSSRISAEGRARIAEAQRKRWATYRKQK